MDQARWHRSEEIYLNALERAPRDREAYVSDACGGDDSLREDVLSLLRSHEEAGEWLEHPAFQPPAEPGVAAMPTDRVGPYKLERELGQGGMGAVYLASRADDQFHKQVAIKFIRTGLKGTFFEQRFRNERQILATLEHPHIARLLDGGIMPDGQPFLVMEYVEGASIDLYCDRPSISKTDRLKLFQKVCSAVHYAHQHLIIHRDLKPSNILVTSEGEPKLLDFGVAKLVGEPAGDGHVTEVILATPLYASPELLQGRPVTTATDVFSLGVLLYRILTRKTLPHDVSQRAFGQLDRDLRSIVLKALSSDPAERYASAELLSEDIRRHLESLPVLAANQPFHYAALKFLRRNRIMVAAGAVVAISLISATGVSLYQLRVAASERQLAERRLQSLRKLTGSVLFELHDSIQTLPGATQARKLLAQSALEYLNSLDPESANDRAQQVQLVEAYRKIADVQGNPTNANLGDTAGAMVSYAKALKIAEQLVVVDPSDLSARRLLATLLQRIADTKAQTGRVEEAVADDRRSLQMFTELAAADHSVEAQQSAGTSHIKLADLLGHPVFPNIGDRTGAVQHYQEALAIFQSGPQRDPVNRRYLGIVYERIGKMMEVEKRAAEALASYEKSFTIREAFAADFPANTNARRDLAIAHEKIADMLTGRKKGKEALARYRQALSIFESLYVLDPSNANAARSLGIEYEKVASLYAQSGHAADARAYYAKALALHQRLASADALNLRAKSDVERVLASLQRKSPAADER